MDLAKYGCDISYINMVWLKKTLNRRINWFILSRLETRLTDLCQDIISTGRQLIMKRSNNKNFSKAPYKIPLLNIV